MVFTICVALNGVPKDIQTLFELCFILIEVCRLFFNHIQSHGWNVESITIEKKYLVAWSVGWEKNYGPNGSILKHVATEA